MPSPLLPFDAFMTLNAPYTLQMSQGFNQALWSGTGLPQDQALAQRIETMMAACRGTVAQMDPKEAFLTRLMALSWHLEYLVTALAGQNTAISDHKAFLESLSKLSAELVDLPQHPSVGAWVQERLQEAQYRHFQHGNQLPPLAPAPTGPVRHAQVSPWTGMPHEHAPLLADDLPEWSGGLS